MKHLKILRGVILSFMFLCVNAVWAYDIEVDGIYYTITSTSDLTLEVTSGDNKYSGNVTIPSTVTYKSKKLTVTSVGENAFRDCSSLRSVTIPNSVTSIGEYAFEGCTRLTSIEIPNSVTWIGCSAFSGCTGLTSIEIPNSVTSIREYAFNGCTSLKDLRIEDGTETLSLGYNHYNGSDTGRGLFYDCPLETLYLGRNLSYYSYYSYGYSPFYGKEALTSVTISNSVTSIGNWAFSGCTGLTSIEIPNSVTWIGCSAFSGCTGLTSIEIPNSVTSIREYAFNGCTSLKDLRIEDGTETLSLGYNHYNSSDTGRGLFNDCPLETLYLGRNISYNTSYNYGYSPFYGKEALTSVTISNSVTSIGSSAFEDCTGLTSIEIPNSVTWIGCSAFSGCTGLTSIEIPNSVTSIREYAFNGCTSLKDLRIEDGTETLSLGYNHYNGSDTGRGLFYDCPLETLYLGRNLSYYSYGYSPFYGKEALTSVTISNSVTSIESSAFRGCTGLTSIEIPNSVTSIGGAAFRGCTGLTSIVVEEGNNVYDSRGNCNAIIETASNTLLFGCSKTIIPNSVTSIRDYAFYGCAGLTSIEIPNSVTSIENSAFRGCTSLKELRIEDGTNTLSLGYNGSYEGIFYDCPLETLYLGRNLSYNTSKYFHSPFYNNTALTSVTIGDCVTSIEKYLFDGCTSLKELRIEDGTGTLSLGCNDFNSCPLETLYLGRNISYNTSNYNYSPFYNKTALTSVTIGDCVTSIENYLFNGCSGLISIYLLGEIPPTVGVENFTTNQYVKLQVYVPENALSAYQKAEVWKNFWDIQEFDATGIEDINNDVPVFEYTNNGILLTNAINKNVAVYTSNGLSVVDIKNYNGEEIALEKGLYIISVNGKSTKVMVK